MSGLEVESETEIVTGSKLEPFQLWTFLQILNSISAARGVKIDLVEYHPEVAVTGGDFGEEVAVRVYLQVGSSELGSQSTLLVPPMILFEALPSLALSMVETLKQHAKVA